ncbi:MAG TPA: diguanylate cyclase, partial [Terriglobales bacterium]|nr:diguanylate cyclase [Terriglobales bacterium]
MLSLAQAAVLVARTTFFGLIAHHTPEGFSHVHNCSATFVEAAVMLRILGNHAFRKDFPRHAEVSSSCPLVMRLRWITILCTVALTLILIGAMMLLGRSVLRENYARLEREHVESDLSHVCLLLQDKLKELDLTAMSYAERGPTYDYMRHPTRGYETANISAAEFHARHIMLYVLVDSNNRVILVRNFDGSSRQTVGADVGELVRATARRSSNTAVSGLMTLTGGPTMIAMRPILPTTRKGPPGGTLIMVRDLRPAQMDELARLAEMPITISGTVGSSAQADGNGRLAPLRISTVALGENRLLASAILTDVWGRPDIRLQIEHDRTIWHKGKRTLHALLLVLVIAGLLLAFANVWMIQRLVVKRVERLIQLITDAETDTGLNARVQISGNDELAQLGRKMNGMLQHLQNSQDKLLAVQERLRYEATHDSLTGIWNRGAALQLLDRELDRSSREGSSVAVIMFDADHFKRINDHFGHTIGDRALQSIAAAITRNLRSFDTCCRYGGEEFLVIAPNCGLEQAEELAVRILASIRTTPLTLPDHSFCITMSAGVTVGQAPIKAEDLLIVAD